MDRVFVDTSYASCFRKSYSVLIARIVPPGMTTIRNLIRSTPTPSVDLLQGVSLRLLLGRCRAAGIEHVSHNLGSLATSGVYWSVRLERRYHSLLRCLPAKTELSLRE